MQEEIYASDKPSECSKCYFWKGTRSGCSLGKGNCYYLIREVPKVQSECDGCPYCSAKKKQLLAEYGLIHCTADELQTIVNEHIKKIVVFAPDKSSGERRQKVKIYFNSVGGVEIPVIFETILQKRPTDAKKRRDLRVTPFSAANSCLSLLSLDSTEFFKKFCIVIRTIRKALESSDSKAPFCFSGVFTIWM